MISVAKTVATSQPAAASQPVRRKMAATAVCWQHATLARRSVRYRASGLSCSSSKSRCWWARTQAESWYHISATKTATPTTPPVTNPATAEWPAAMVASRPASEPVSTAVTTPIIPAVVRKAGQYPLRKPRMASRRDGGTLAR